MYTLLAHCACKKGSFSHKLERIAIIFIKISNNSKKLHGIKINVSIIWYRIRKQFSHHSITNTVSIHYTLLTHKY